MEVTINLWWIIGIVLGIVLYLYIGHRLAIWSQAADFHELCVIMWPFFLCLMPIVWWDERKYRRYEKSQSQDDPDKPNT